MKLRRIFAARLQALMEERMHLDTQVKVAAAADISQSSVGRFLKGSVAPTLDNLESLALVFEVSPTTLIHDPAHPSGVYGLDYQLRDLPPAERRKVFEYADTIKRMYANDLITLTAKTKLDESKTKAIQMAAGKAVTTNRGNLSEPSKSVQKSRKYQ